MTTKLLFVSLALAATTAFAAPAPQAAPTDKPAKTTKKHHKKHSKKDAKPAAFTTQK